MAEDNKQGFWDYIWEDTIKSNPVLPWNAIETSLDTLRNIYEGAGNVASWHPWSEDNRNPITWNTTESYKKPHKSYEQYMKEAQAAWDVTLDDIINSLWNVSTNWGNIIAPQDSLWLNDYSDVKTNTESDDNSSIWKSYADVEKNLTLKWWDRERQLEERIIKDEENKVSNLDKWLSFREYLWEEGVKENPLVLPFKWAKDAIYSVKDYNTDKAIENTLEAMRQGNEKHVALGYDPNSKDMTFMVFNTWQWITDDFHDTITSAWQTKEREFDSLLNQYQVGLMEIEMKEDMDEFEKYKAMDALTDELIDQINKRQIFKARKDDYYANWWLFWAFGRNINNLIHWTESTVDAFWRRYEQFSAEDLEKLSQNDIAPGPLKINRDMLEKFLKAREENSEYNRLMTYDWTDSEYNINYALTDESRSYMKAIEEARVYGPLIDEINAKIKNWEIDEMTWSEILSAAIADVVEPTLAQMHVYLDSALWYYVAVKNKRDSGTPITESERTILTDWPAIFQFMNDYSSAVSRFVSESVNQWIKDWVLIWAVDSIDWMSIQDFFKDAVYDSNILAGWFELDARESVIDAMQHINQNIARLYWTGKWDFNRRMKTELNSLLWLYWYIAGEIWQDIYTLGLRWLEGLWWDWAGKLADYSHADFSRWMMMATDYSIRWDKNRWRLMATFGLQASENIPELVWTIVWEKPLLKWNIWTRSTAETLASINRIKNAAKRERKLAQFINATRSGQPSISWALNAIWNKLWDWLWMWNTSRTIVSRWLNLLKRKVSDQVIDSTLGYFDTENYSTPSYLISLIGTWLFETFPWLFKDTELLKMIKNKLKWGAALDWTGWKLMNVITSDDEIAKRWGLIYWLEYDSFRFMAKNWAMDSLDELLRYSYQALDPEGKRIMDSLSKDIAIKTLNDIKQIDWKSTYWRNLLRILNNNKTNWLDIWKFVLWIPWKVEFGGFQSWILFKEWAETQGRYLLKEYDVELDKIDWQFRRKLENWFTEEDIRQIAERTSHKDVIENWKVNKKYFVEDKWKYILNSEWAEALWLKVSEYTEAMRKADILKQESEWVEKMLNENLEKLAAAKWFSKDTIARLAKSWAFSRMIKEFEVFC